MEPVTVIVTGASRGIGKAISMGMLDAGAHVVGVSRPPPAGSSEASAVSPHSAHRYLGVEADITRREDCERIVTLSLEAFGSVGVLVNNAALSHGSFPRFHDTSLEDVSIDSWWEVFETNVLGAVQIAQAALPTMTEARWGRIVNISTSKSSMLASGVLPYGPSKAALAAMTVGWSAQLFDLGITVNEVLPGGPTGPRTREKHWWAADTPTWPAEIMVPPIQWLSSTASDGTTGRRFVARLWDPSLPDAEAVQASSSPAGWPVSEQEVPKPPTLAG